MPPPTTATLGGALLSTRPPWQTARVEASSDIGGPVPRHEWRPGAARGHRPMRVAY
jgi:hypothetical protein